MAGKKEIPRELSIYINDKAVVNSLGGITREITKTNAEMRSLNKNSASYDEDLKKLQNTLGQLKDRQSDFRNEIYQTNTLFGKMSSLLGPVATGLLSAFSIGAIIGSFTAAVSSAFKIINQFEQGVADLSAITGATGDNLKYLKEQAIELGKTTQGGAIAVVEAYKLIASAKPELLDNVSALNAVTAATITLAQAAGMEMPAAATALTDAMNQFGADANQAAVFVDALANGAKYGAAEIPQVTEALLKFGAVAKSSNISIQESTALVELLAEKGLKGAEAGTALRNVLLKISAPDALPKEAQQIIEKLGISMTFLKDKTIPVQEKLEALKPVIADNANAVKVFGLENVTSAINVINNTERLGELTSKMGEVGTASEQAAIKMDTVNGKTELMKSTYDSLILSIGSGGGVVSGFFKFFAQGATDMLNGLIRLNTSWDELKNKSMEKGTQSGKSIFQERLNSLKGTGSNAEISGSIKTTAFKDYQRLQKEYLANEQKLKDFNPYALNLGESGKDLQKKREQLAGDLAEQRTIIRESLKEINKDTKASSDEKIKINTDATAELTDAEQKSADKAAKKQATADAKLKKSKLDLFKDLLLAKANLDKAELENYLVNNQTKITSETKLTEDVVLEETKRLEGVKSVKITALEEEKTAKIEKATLEIEDKKVLEDTKAAIDLEYLTKKQELELEFQKSTTDLKTQAEIDQKQIKQDQLLAENEVAMANATTEYDLQRVQEEERYQAELAALNDRLAKGKLTEDQYRALRARAETDHSNAMIQIAHAERDAKLSAMGTLFGGIAKLLGENTKAGQIAALAQVAISEGLAIARIWEQQSALPSPFDIAAKVGGTAVAVANVIAAATRIKKVKTPKFFYGGDTGTNASLGYDEYGPMTGIVHKNEYVIPEVMTANPRYANTLAWLEQERTGNVKKFATGGATSPGTISSVTPEAVTDQTAMLYGAIMNLNAILSNGITAKTVIGYQEANDIQTLNDERTASTANGTLNN